MLGKDKFVENNTLLNKTIKEKQILIATHRGSAGGNIMENTIPAYTASLLMDADMFECDVVESTDGILYAFHDGREKQILGIEGNLRTFSSKEIDVFDFINSNGLCAKYHVEKLEDVIKHFKGDVLYNIDRAFRLQQLDILKELFLKYPYAVKQAVLKAPVQREYLEYLEACPVKFMFMPIVGNMEGLKLVLSYENINTVGVELIANNKESELFQEENIRWIREQGLFCWANAIVLDGNPESDLFGGLDDSKAILGDPEGNWGKMIDKGINVIQTDWPALLSRFRENYI